MTDAKIQICSWRLSLFNDSRPSLWVQSICPLMPMVNTGVSWAWITQILIFSHCKLYSLAIFRTFLKSFPLSGDLLPPALLFICHVCHSFCRWLFWLAHFSPFFFFSFFLLPGLFIFCCCFNVCLLRISKQTNHTKPSIIWFFSLSWLFSHCFCL